MQRFWRLIRKDTTRPDTPTAPWRCSLALEERVLFDASAASVVASVLGDAPDVDNSDAQHDADQHDQSTPHIDQQAKDLAQAAGAMQKQDAGDPDQTPDSLLPPTDAVSQSQARQLVVISTAVENWQDLAHSMDDNAEVLLVDADDDGIARITEALAHRKDIDSLHILSHGESGEVFLGTSTLDNAALHARAQEIGSWSRALTPDADILLWSCDTGAGSQGAQLVAGLAQRTGADVAASDDATGHTDKGGDWQLETRVGDVDASLPFAESVTNEFHGLLNDAPILGVDSSTLLVTEGDPATFLDSSLTLWDDDTLAQATVHLSDMREGDVLSFTESDNILGSWNAATGTLTLTGEASAAEYQTALRSVRFEHTGDDPGTSRTVTYSLTDTNHDASGANTIEAQRDILITPVDDAPVVDTPLADIHVQEDAGSSSIDLSGLFTDPDNDDLAISVAVAGNTNPGLVDASINGTTLNLDYLADQHGSATITLRGTSNGQTVETSFQVTVDPVDDAPTVAATIPDVHVQEDAGTSDIDLSGVFTDLDNDDSAITYEVTGNTNNGLVQTSLSGSTLHLDYLADQHGSATITILATSNGKTVETSFQVTVDPVDDAPTVAAPIADVEVAEDAPTTDIDLSGVFTDLDNEDANITYEVVNNTNGQLVQASISGSTLHLDYVANQNGTADITIRATSGGQSVEISFGVTVTPGADAPVLGGSDIDLGQINEDTPMGSNQGTSVESLVQTLQGQDEYSDPDGSSPAGLAIVGADNANGVWEYSVDGGTSWQEVGPCSDNTALLLAASAQNRIRFRPDADYHGQTSLTLRAWDQSNGSNGSVVSIDATGGATAFSTQSAQALLDIVSVNDAPVLDGDPTLPPMMEDADPGNGQSVADILAGMAQDDADSNPDLGLAVTGMDLSAVSGTWEYSEDGGTSWTEFPADLAADNALLLAHSARIRFTPDANENGVTTLSYRVWDESNNSSTGDRIDPGTGGGDSAFSSVEGSLTQAVSPDNDTPDPMATRLEFTENHTGSQAVTIGIADLRYEEPSGDMEQSWDQMVYELSAALPAHGRVELNVGGQWVELGQGGLFSQQDISQGKVRYVYTGGELSANGSDSVGFTLRDGAGGEAVGTLDIVINEANAPIQYSGSDIQVQEYIRPGDVNPIDIGLTDPDGNPDSLQITLESLPGYGELQFFDGSAWVAATTGLTFTQADMTAGYLRYVHDGTEPVAAAAQTTFQFSVDDGRGSQISNAVVTLSIAPRNDAPTVTNNGLTLDEGQSQIIGSAHLFAHDVDSPHHQLTYTITSDTTNGWLELGGQRLGAGSTFQQVDIDNGDLVYVHGDGENTSDSFAFDLRDGNGELVSDTFSIDVNPVNDAPEVERTETVWLKTQHTRTLRTSDLDGSDMESTDTELTWTWNALPQNVHIEINGQTVNEFTHAQLAAGDVLLVHDGPVDNTGHVDVTFTLHDNETDHAPTDLTDTGTLRIYVYETAGPGIPNHVPLMENNEPLVVLEDNSGGTVRNVITSDLLSAWDRDGDDPSFTITDTGSLHGTIYLDGQALGVGDSFTQADINNGLVSYANDGSENTVASFQFTISDGKDQNDNPDGLPDSAPQTFNITITPVNDAPDLQADNPVNVDEHDDAGTDDADAHTLADVENASALTVDNLGGDATLLWSDVDNSDPNQMVFEIVSNPGGGTIRVWNGTSWQSVGVGGHFSIQNVRDGDVAYFHNPDSEPNPAQDQFQVQLTDGGDTPSQTVTVDLNVTPVNDAPTANGGRASINEGGTQVLNQGGSHLSSGDPDNTTAEMTYALGTGPQHGTVWFDQNNDGQFDAGEAMASGDTFTQADLDAGRLRYTHDGTENFTDTFTFTATDPSGLTSAPATVTMTMRPINDTPTIITNTGGQVYEGDSLILSTENLDNDAGDGSNLKAWDPDNSATQVQFRITQNVDKGYLYLDTNGNGVLDGDEKQLGAGSVFTLDDLHNDRLIYQHDGSEPLGDSATDQFGFRISDSSGGNEPTGTFNINILATNDAPGIVAPTDALLDEDSSVLIKGIEVSDVDVAQGTDTLSLELSVGHGLLTLQNTGGVTLENNGTGTVTISGSAEAVNAVLDSGVRYTPDADYNDISQPGTPGDVLHLTLSDNGNTGQGGEQTATTQTDITIRPVNDAPEVVYDPGGSNISLDPTTGDIPVSLNEDDTLTLGPIQISDTELTLGETDGGSEDGTVRVTLNVDHGRLTLSDTTGLGGDTNGSDGTLSFTGSLTDVNNALSSLQYNPDTHYNGSDTISLLVTDQGNEGVGGAKSVSGSFAVTVSPVNDAPVLDTSGPASVLAEVEDTTGEGTSVAAILGDLVSDVDADPVEGMALVGITTTANGTWQYNTGSGWQDVPTNLAETSALLLGVDAKLRFVGAADFNGTDTGQLTWRAWDTTEGSAGGRLDVSTATSEGPVSLQTRTLTADVSAVNDQPGIADLPFVVDYTEGAGLQAQGTPVTLAPGASISDFDIDNAEDDYAGATLTVQRNAVLQDTDRYDIGGDFTKDNGTLKHNGTDVGSYELINGKLTITFNDAATGDIVDAALQSLTFSSIKDNPPPTQIIAITFRDGNAGEQGTGGELTATGTVFVDITATNDAPIISDPDGGDLADVDEDDTEYTSVADILTGTQGREPDGGGLTGIAITDADRTNGVWDYSTDNGQTWNEIVAGQANQDPLHLDGSALIRFRPDPNFNGQATFNYHAWDASNAVASGDSQAIVSTGGDTAYSVNTADATVTVNPVNDAPEITDGGSLDAGNSTENQAITVSGPTIGDLDLDPAITQDTGNDPDLRLTLENAAGTINLTTTTGLHFVDGTGNGQSRVVVEGTLSELNAALSSFEYTPGDDSGVSESIAITISDLGNVGGGALQDSTTIVVNNIQPVNDAPVLDMPSDQIMNEDGVLDLGGEIQLQPVDERDGEVHVTLAISQGYGELDITPVNGLQITDNGDSLDLRGTTDQINTALQSLTFTPEAEHNTPQDGTVQITVTYSDEGYGLDGQQTAPALETTQHFNITVNPVNDAPEVVGVGGDVTIYDEAQGPVFVTQDASLTDMEFQRGEVADFDGGSLSVRLAVGAIQGDVLGLANNGLLTVSGSQVLYNGTVIGSFTAGDHDTALTVALNGNADQQAVSALLEAVTYDHTTDNPSNFGNNLKRVVEFTFNDGDGTARGGQSTSAPVTTVVTIGDLHNDAPVIGGMPGDTTLDENAVNPDTGTPAFILPGATVSDVDSTTLGGGQLTIGYNSGSDAWDQLGINNQGTGAGLIGVNGSNITYGGTVIGTLSGGSDGADLVVSLNDQATPEAVQAMLRQATYHSTSHNPDVDQTANVLQITLRDSSGADAATSAPATLNLTVTPQNDAPVLDNSSDLHLLDIQEDSTDSSTVAEILGSDNNSDPISDVDDGSVEGIAVTGADSTHGTWQYNTGSGWTSLPNVSEGAALLLQPDATIRFVPNADYNGPATLQFRAWDQTSGTEGQQVDTTTNGGGTAFSTATDTVSINVTAVNDDPVPTGSPTTQVVLEDSTDHAGESVQNLFGGLFSDPNDAAELSGADQFAGVAVVGNTATAAQGNWQYSTDNGQTWTNVGNVADNNALLLNADAKLRFVPAGDFNGTPAALTVRLADNSGGALADGTHADLNGPASTAPFARTTTDLQANVLPVNDAPTLDDSGNTPADFQEGGGFVSIGQGVVLGDTEFLNGEISDFDGATLTVNISSNAQDGDQLSILHQGTGAGQIGISGSTITYGGAVIGSFTAGDHNNAMTVTFNANADMATVQALIQHVGFSSTSDNPDNFGADPSREMKFVFKDGDGTERGGQDTSNTATVSVNITPVNDAPVIGGMPGNTTLDENAVNPDTGTPAFILPGVTIGDVDSTTLGGGQLTIGYNSGSDAWDQLGINNQGTGVGQIGVSGSNITYGGTVIGTLSGGSDGADLVVSLNDQATPEAVQAMLRQATYHSTSHNPDVDQTANVLQITLRDSSGADAATSAPVILNLTVTPQNDAPVLDNSSDLHLPDVSEDMTNPSGSTVAEILGSDNNSDPITDVDNNALEGMAVTGADSTHGTWQYDTGSGWTNFPNVSEDAALLLQPDAKIRFVPDADFDGTADMQFRAWDQTSGTEGQQVDTTTNGGGTAFSTDTDSVTVDITPVNDTPEVDAPTARQNLLPDGTLEFSQANGNAIVVDDLDAAGQDVTVTLEVPRGELNLSGINGLSSVQGNGTTTVTFTGSLTEVNAALEGMTYTGDGVTGTLHLTVTINDNGHTGTDPGLTGSATDERDTAQVELRLTDDINTAPVITLPNSASTAPGQDLELSGNLAIQVTDVDAFNGEVRVTLHVDHGTLTLNDTTGLNFPTGDSPSGQDSITFAGQLDAVQSALDNLVFSPEDGFTGEAQLQVTVNDQGNTGAGGALSDSETLEISVQKPNPVEPPHLPDDSPTPPPSHTPPPPQDPGPSASPGGGNKPSDLLPPVPQSRQSDPMGFYQQLGNAYDGDGDTGEQFSLQLENQTFRSDRPTDFTIPPSAIRHNDPSIQVTLEATMPDGSPLPSWISFNASDGTFSIDPPDGLEHVIEVLVKARDEMGNEAKSTFVIELVGAQADSQQDDGTPPRDGEPAEGDQADRTNGNAIQLTISDAGQAAPDQSEPNQPQAEGQSVSGKPGLDTQIAEAGHSGLLRQASQLANLFGLG